MDERLVFRTVGHEEAQCVLMSLPDRPVCWQLVVSGLLASRLLRLLGLLLNIGW